MSHPVGVVSGGALSGAGAAFSSDEEEDVQDDDGLETLDLEQEQSTSVAILSKVGAGLRASGAAATATAASSSFPAAASSSAAAASSRPPAKIHGNFLARSEQMGFEEDAGARAAAIAAAASDSDVSEEEGEWMSMDAAMAASQNTTATAAAKPASSYTPSAGGQRARRMLPASAPSNKPTIASTPVDASSIIAAPRRL